MFRVATNISFNPYRIVSTAVCIVCQFFTCSPTLAQNAATLSTYNMPMWGGADWPTSFQMAGPIDFVAGYRDIPDRPYIHAYANAFAEGTDSLVAEAMLEVDNAIHMDARAGTGLETYVTVKRIYDIPDGDYRGIRLTLTTSSPRSKDGGRGVFEGSIPSWGTGTVQLNPDTAGTTAAYLTGYFPTGTQPSEVEVNLLAFAQAGISGPFNGVRISEGYVNGRCDDLWLILPDGTTQDVSNPHWKQLDSAGKWSHGAITGGGLAQPGGLEASYSTGLSPVGTLTSTYLTPSTPNDLQQAIGPAATESIDFGQPSGTAQVWNIGFNGTLAGEASLTVAYDPTLVGNADPSSLVIKHYENGSWTTPAGQIVDPISHTISFKTSDFSPFMLALSPASFPGDFNNDGSVDSADYVIWRRNMGTSQDYNTWRVYFGQSNTGLGSAASPIGVPEPVRPALILALLVTPFTRVTRTGGRKERCYRVKIIRPIDRVRSTRGHCGMIIE